MNTLFESATLKLTGWYLMILMVLSLLFSMILFQLASSELRHGLRAPVQDVLFQSGLFTENEAARDFRETRYQEGISHLVGNLIIMNVITLVAGGGVSYILARRTLQPIQEAMEAQGQFTSDASHELRTPLTIMQSEIEVGLRDKRATKQTYHDLLASNLDEVHRLRELSDRLLLLSSERDLPLTPVSLEDVSIEAVSHVVKLAQQKHITVANEVTPLKVNANPEALADVLAILIENAIKYSPDRTTVRVASRVQGKAVFIDVIDQGPGISDEDLPHIFERFYRADASRSRQNVEGYGLGLSIARRIIDQHGGQLTVKNIEDTGAVFTIRLSRF